MVPAARWADSRYTAIVGPALILIDGLPGSGKTTVADDLGVALVEEGRTVTVWQEMDPIHPLHVFKLDPMGAATAALPAWMNYDEFADASLAKWGELIAELAPASVTIIETYPFQSAVRVLMQVGAPAETIDRYWSSLLELLMVIRPTLVLFQEDDPAGAFLETAEARGREWTEYVVRAVEASPLFRAEGRRGVEAVAAGMVAYQSRMNDLAQSWPYPALRLPARPTNYRERTEAIIGFAKEYLRLT